MAIVKSKLTTVCTESTSGVANPASNRHADSQWFQCRADERQPIESAPYSILTEGRLAPSRRVPRSGKRPTNQNKSETVKYVETANTSHTRGLLNCGCTFIALG